VSPDDPNDHVKARDLAEIHLAKLAVLAAKDHRLDTDFLPFAKKYGRAKIELHVKECVLLLECREEVARTCGGGVTSWKQALVGRGYGGMSNIEAMLATGTKALANPAQIKLAVDKWVDSTKPVNVKAFAAKLVPRKLPPMGGNTAPPPPAPPPAESVTDAVDVDAEVVEAADEVLDALGVEDHAGAIDALRDLQAENVRLEGENARLEAENARLKAEVDRLSQPTPRAPEP
jgi:hypothetical protein